MQYSKEESKAIWNQNAEFWDCAMGDESNDFHREVVRPKVTELLNPDPTGIDKTTTSTDVEEVSRYSVNGQRLVGPTKGLNIVKYSDGSVKKVAVE